ncbi:hypothetical protein [Burkholderia cenocepacia]|uniref:hypothetical protein n=1 Tax=Burkholderia cenocepacia TaxID=95486 RepID=UPI000A400339|nr:hypothetical protein [Burkholderia cenocepacia]
MNENAYFPSGEDICEYDGWESWNYQDLAWQYARRNKNFQKQCLALDASDPDFEQRKQDIADEFFLSRHKDFREETLVRGEGVSAQYEISRKPNGTQRLRFSRTLKSHQVAITLDLRSSLHSQDALARQIELVTKAVERRVTDLRNLHPNIQQLPSPTITLAEHILRIRSFDLKNSGQRRWKDIGEILRENGDRRDCDTLGEIARKHLYPEAVKYIELGYVALVTSKSTRSKMPKN